LLSGLQFTSNVAAVVLATIRSNNIELKRCVEERKKERKKSSNDGIGKERSTI
jgi:hypothetical protein